MYTFLIASCLSFTYNPEYDTTILSFFLLSLITFLLVLLLIICGDPEGRLIKKYCERTKPTPSRAHTELCLLQLDSNPQILPQ